MNTAKDLSELQQMTQANLALIEAIHKIRQQGVIRVTSPDGRLMDDLIYSSEILTTAILWSTYEIVRFDSRGAMDDIYEEIRILNEEAVTDNQKPRRLERVNRWLKNLPSNA